ncbi:MAG TPA: NAD-dependent epimerase/dehydratase family protein [Gaiellaceae bacterium]|nr:NAD-dependent epimerase/dehydratase family protein [Gaiellaceae bacterium]
MSDAAGLLGRSLDGRSRVLLLGAGGWFGATFLDLVARSGSNAEVLALTGRPRTIAVGGTERELHAWDWRRIAAFEPTLVVNCAFLTREQLPQLGYDRYVAENVRLSGRFLRTLALPSVTAAVTVSSGAAVEAIAGAPDAETNPYGYLKWSEETAARALAERFALALVVCRAWSVSGELVQRPRDYAFSDLVLQARSGRIEIRAAHEVWRRYVSVHDLLAVCAALALDGRFETVDSGGPLVELGELAATIVRELAPGATIERPAPGGFEADRYHSDDRTWQDACTRLRHQPASLEEQIHAVAAGLAEPAA